MLCGVGWRLVIDIWGQPISPIFKVQTLKMGLIGCPDMSVTVAILHYVRSQKSEGLKHAVAEA
jgi:hypothetical protein